MPKPTPDAPGPKTTMPGAGYALALLLAINLFNYIDRYILAAILPLLAIDAAMLDPSDPYLQTKLGLLGTAFMASYLGLAPLFGWLGGRMSRWVLVGGGVVLWSLASGASGLAGGYLALFLTRCLVGVGEAAYGPIAPSMISDLYPVARRGRVLALFYMAIPVGSALGYVIGGAVATAAGSWRDSFLVTFAGGVLGLLCFLKRDIRPVPASPSERPSYLATLRGLLRVRSFVLCCIGMTCTTFILGGVALWVPAYIFQREARFRLNEEAVKKLEDARDSAGRPLLPAEVIGQLRAATGDRLMTYPEFRALLSDRVSEAARRQFAQRIYDAATAKESITNREVTTIFGGITVVSGFLATMLGGWIGDKLRNRGVRGAYFHAAGWTTLLAWPCFVGMLYAPFPWAWGLIFLTVFWLFFNTGPANTILANVTTSEVRATAFAVNILVIHLLGDAISPPVIGFIADLSNLNVAFLVCSVFILLGGGVWVLGAKYLDEDTRRADAAGIKSSSDTAE